MMLNEKPDPTRYPNTLTRPDPKPEKVLPVAALLQGREGGNQLGKKSLVMLGVLLHVEVEK